MTAAIVENTNCW